MSRYPAQEGMQLVESKTLADQTTRILFDDGLIPVEEETALPHVEEKYPVEYPVEEKYTFSRAATDTWTTNSPLELQLPERPDTQKRLCGMRRRNFWLVTAIVIAVVLGGIGVGTWMAMTKKDVPSASDTQPTAIKTSLAISELSLPDSQTSTATSTSRTTSAMTTTSPAADHIKTSTSSKAVADQTAASPPAPTPPP